MAIEISGKLVKVLAEQSGQGRNGRWVKQEFVLETQDNYPKKICFSLWNDKVDVLRNLNSGDLITVSFNPESREYNERWYTELKAWKVVVGNSANTSGAAQSNSAPPPPFSNNDIPPEMEDDGKNDLPF